MSFFYPFRGLRAEGPKRKTTSYAGGSQKASSTGNNTAGVKRHHPIG